MDKNLEKIVRASERMQLLINDLLKFSRHTSTNEDFSLIKLAELIGDVVADMEVDIERNGAQIQIDPLPEIWGIPSQMRQLFQNLISNALKFRKNEIVPAVHIYSDKKTVLVTGTDNSQDTCRIVVEDNGIGFDPKFASEIFVVFKRLHSYHEFEGSGVGLSICKKIIERHNGHISAESKPGVGSKFIIDLPIAKFNRVNPSRHRAAKGTELPPI